MALFNRPPKRPRPPSRPPGRPPFGPPGGPPSQPPFGPPGGPPPPPGSGAQGGPPSGPPPKFTPQESQGSQMKSSGGPQGGPNLKAVDPGAVFPCKYRYTYIWPNRGEGFWAYVTYVGPTSLAGWRYGYWGWEYFGMDLKRIRSFYCY